MLVQFDKSQQFGDAIELVVDNNKVFRPVGGQLPRLPMTPGTHVVEVRWHALPIWRCEVVVGADQNTPLTIPLLEEPSTLVLEISESKVALEGSDERIARLELFIDDKIKELPLGLRKQNELMLPVGVRNVALKYKGHEVYSEAVYVKSRAEGKTFLPAEVKLTTYAYKTDSLAARWSPYSSR